MPESEIGAPVSPEPAAPPPQGCRRHRSHVGGCKDCIASFVVRTRWHLDHSDAAPVGVVDTPPPSDALFDNVLVLLRELQDRERLAFGAPLPETSAVIDAFAGYVRVRRG